MNGTGLLNKSSPIEGEGLVRVKDENVRFHDVDFWLVFEKRLIKSSPESFVEDLRNQFETINIVKIKQYFFLEKSKPLFLIFLTSSFLLLIIILISLM